MASKLMGVCKLPTVCKVKVADGAVLRCDSFIPQCPWTSHGHEFVTDFKLISLGVYDAILGMDWLKKHSPMHIDWEAQWMTITTDQGSMDLKAVTSDQIHCSAISSQELVVACKQGSVAYVVHLNDANDTGGQRRINSRGNSLGFGAVHRCV